MNDAIEVAYYPCAFCGTGVKTRWIKDGGGMISDYNENVLIANWVYHPSCWDGLVRENSPAP